MKREEPAETGPPTLIKSLSPPEDKLEGRSLAEIGKAWDDWGVHPWVNEPFPLEEEQRKEASLPSTLAVPLGFL
jgi:hypothetical protein